MPDRRAFLTGTAAAAAIVLFPLAEEAPAIVGSVTNPTGTVNGKNLATLIDAFAGVWSGILHPAGGAMAQWNYLGPLLSDKPDPCTAEGTTSQFRPNEVTLRFTIVGWADLPGDAPVFPPPVDLPLTLSIPDPATPVTTSDGVHRVVTATVMQARKNGGAGSDTNATSGTLTFTRLDATSHEGSYDLQFGASRVTGSFVAPWCGPLPA